MLEKVIVVRHAEPAREDADPGLSKRGGEQATLLAEKIRHLVNGSAPTVISSTLRRAVHTANAIAFTLDVAVHPHPLLCCGEIDEIVAYLATKAKQGGTLIVVGHQHQGWGLLEAFAQKACNVAPQHNRPDLDHAGGCVLDVKRRTLSAL